MTDVPSRETLRFGEFELNVAAYELRRNGRTVRLERRPMDLLILLVERHGNLVTRADIVDRLWGPDVFVDVETGVHTAVRKLRQALRDSAETPRFVETVPGRGYRFIAEVSVRGAQSPVLAAPLVEAIETPAARPGDDHDAVREADQEPGARAGRRAALIAIALI